MWNRFKRAMDSVYRNYLSNILSNLSFAPLFFAPLSVARVTASCKTVLCTATILSVPFISACQIPPIAGLAIGRPVSKGIVNQDTRNQDTGNQDISDQNISGQAASSKEGSNATENITNPYINLDVSPGGKGQVNGVFALSIRDLSTFSFKQFEKDSLGHQSEVKWLSRYLGADSKAKLLSIDQDGKGLIWVNSVGAELEARRLEQFPAGIKLAAFSVKQGLIAYYDGSNLGIFEALNPQNSVVLENFKIVPLALEFAPLKHNPAGSYLLISGSDGRIYGWDFLRSQQLDRYLGASEPANVLIAHPKAPLFFSAGRSIYAWRYFEREVGLALAADPNRLFGERFFGGEANFRRASGGQEQIIDQIGISQDGSSIAVGLRDGRIEVWLVRGFKKIVEIEAHRGALLSLAINRDGRKLATSGRDGKLKLWEVRDKTLVAGLSPEFELSLLKELSDLKLLQLSFGSQTVDTEFVATRSNSVGVSSENLYASRGSEILMIDLDRILNDTQ